MNIKASKTRVSLFLLLTSNILFTITFKNYLIIGHRDKFDNYASSVINLNSS